MGAVAVSNYCWLLRNQLNGDVATYFYIGERLADGAVLYKDIGELNPPLMSYLMVPSVWIGRAIHLPTHIVWYAGAWVGFAAVVLLSERLSRGVIPNAWLWPLFFLAEFQAGIVDRRQFSQRDQLAAYSLLPIVFLCAGRMLGRQPGRAWVLAAALLASVCLALKPFFLLPWLLLVVLPLFWSGWRRPPWKKLPGRPEFWVVVAFHVVYLVFIVIFCQEFVGFAPVVAKYYKFYNSSMRAFVPLWPYVVVLIGISCVLLAQLLKRIAWLDENVVALATAGTVTAFGFLIEAIAQHKAIPYHLIPFVVFSWFVAATICEDLAMNRFRSAAVHRTVLWAIVVAGLAMVTVSVWTAGTRIQSLYPDALRTVIANDKRSGPLMFVVGDPWCVFPLAYDSHQELVQRDYGFLWMVPGLYHDQAKFSNGHWKPAADAVYHRPDEMTHDEKTTYDEFRHVLGMKPRLIYVNTGDKPALGNLRFNYLDYLLQDPEMARRLKDYSALSDPKNQPGCEPRCFTLLTRKEHF